MLVGALGSGSGWSCTGLAEGDGAEGFRGTDDPDQENFGRHSSSTLKRTDYPRVLSFGKSVTRMVTVLTGT